MYRAPGFAGRILHARPRHRNLLRRNRRRASTTADRGLARARAALAGGDARASTAASCPSSRRATTSGGSCPLPGAYSRTRTRARDLDGIAYTRGPGLAGALLVGASIAHALAYALGKPVVGVHHMEGHLLSPLLADAAAGVSVRRAARFGRPQPAVRGRGRRALSAARRHPGRCCRRSVRQDGKAARTGLPRRAGARPAGGGRARWRASRCPGRCWTAATST